MVCAALLVASGANFGTRSGSAAELLGHWDFSSVEGEKVQDLSGQGNHGSIALVRPGGAGGLVFDGYAGHGEMPGTRRLTFPSGLSIAAWIRPERLSRNNVVFCRPNPNPTWTTPAIGLFAPEEGRIGLGLWTPTKTIVTSPQPIPLSRWTLVVGTCDNGVARLYLDGELVAEQPAGGTPPASGAPFLVATGTPANRFYAGRIGELQLYGGALAAGEIRALYQQTASRYPNEPAPAESGKTTVVRSKVKPNSPWKEYATRTLDLLDGYRKAEEPIRLSKYGGWLGRRLDATGFFRAEKIDGRWWLIDPEGYRFTHVGVSSISPGSSRNMRQSFAEKFGDDASWARATTGLLAEHHFNGTGGWTDHRRLHQSGQPLPYIVRLNLMSSFGGKLGVTHRVPGHTGFELECIPVFHPDFPAHCAEQVEPLAALRDDPYVLGIYSDNELQTPKLENYLKLDPTNPAQRPNYEAALRWLRQRKGKADVSADEITIADRLEFAGYAFELYYRIVSRAIKKADPNHLYIGSRLMGPNFRNPFIWKAAAPYCDVVSVNYYSCWGPDLNEVAYWQTLCPRPIMITEFYVKGEDSGLPNETGAGWIVPTQADRGRFYQHYVLGLLESRACVGWHWFKYQDNDPEQENAEPSNIDSNKGIVDIRYQPYAEFLQWMGQVNREVYPLTRYFDAKD